MEGKQIITIATELGYLLLKYGGEVYRAEQSACYVCNFYGIHQVDVFAIPNNIIVTITQGEDFITKTRRITSSEIDLTKVDKLNALSREIGETLPAYEEVMERLRQIDEMKPYPSFVRIVGSMLVCVGFTMLFDADWLEAIIAAVAGFFGMGAMILLEKRHQNSFLKIACCSFVIAAIVHGASMLSGGSIKEDPIIAGSLMILVPGLALTNSMRDFMAHDYVAGVTKLAEALMIALATALGVAVIILSTYVL